MKKLTVAVLLLVSLVVAVGTGACSPIPGADTIESDAEGSAPPAAATESAVAVESVAATAAAAEASGSAVDALTTGGALTPETVTEERPYYSTTPSTTVEAVTSPAATDGGDVKAPGDKKGETSGKDTEESGEKKDGTSDKDKNASDNKDKKSDKDKKPEKKGAKTKTVTLSIDCKTILKNMGKLTEGKEKLVGDGWIMKEKKVALKDGETVFDVLVRECKAAKLHMEHSYVPMYESAYIEGINNLYEFDAGELSGWMYSVNGWYPNYGCSQYKLEDGDVIEWRYTCDLGKDVGGEGAVSG
ncbi:MAG: DUF4430 domain-containing protein [Clostridiales Family XIII bacterium]|jgi:hypothetical protein|nr:DUF4430 domain-containing protein [Clostridiales Family XIII bacterium]